MLINLPAFGLGYQIEKSQEKLLLWIVLAIKG